MSLEKVEKPNKSEKPKPAADAEKPKPPAAEGGESKSTDAEKPKPATEKTPTAKEPKPEAPARLRMIDAAEVPPLGERCAAATAVLVGKDDHALVRCSRPVKKGSALCELHLLHLGLS